MDTVSAFAPFRPLEFDPWVYLPPLLEAHQAGLGAHCLRTCRKVGALAHLLAIPEEQRLALSLGALYHDVGKLYLPAGLLSAGRTLTPEETLLVRRHVPFALRILREAPLAEVSIDAIAHHHERWDGGGYPLVWPGSGSPWRLVSSPSPTSTTPLPIRAPTGPCSRVARPWTSSAGLPAASSTPASSRSPICSRRTRNP